MNTDEDEAHLDHQMLSKAPDLEHDMSSLMMDVMLDALESGSAHSSRPLARERRQIGPSWIGVVEYQDDEKERI